MLNTGRVTITVNYPLVSTGPAKDGGSELMKESKPTEEYHCDSWEEAFQKLSSLQGWSSFVLVGTNNR